MSKYNSHRYKRNPKIRTPQPVQSIEVSEKHLGRRIIIFVIVLVIAIASLSTAIALLTRTEKGWQTITPRSSAKTNCSDDFEFLYYFDGTYTKNKSVYRDLNNVYTSSTVTAYQLFTPYESIDDVNNVYYINRHINQTVEVDPVLYNAFEKLSNTRFLYTASIFYVYEQIGYSESEWQAKELDPRYNDDVKRFFTELTGFALDPAKVNIELLGDNKIILHVSDDYVEYASAEGVADYIGFGYLTNAFIIDMIADDLIAEGFTDGVISSYDGYYRSLRVESNTMTTFNRMDEGIYYSGTIQNKGKIAAISLYSFSLSAKDAWRHYRYSDGTTTHYCYDLRDAVSKCGSDYLLCYSSELSCADLAIKLYPIWTVEDLDASVLKELSLSGFDYVRTDESNIYYSDASLVVTPETGYDGVTFVPALEKQVD